LTHPLGDFPLQLRVAGVFNDLLAVFFDFDLMPVLHTLSLPLNGVKQQAWLS
jgi:hypothetical protein